MRYQKNEAFGDIGWDAFLKERKQHGVILMVKSKAICQSVRPPREISDVHLASKPAGDLTN